MINRWLKTRLKFKKLNKISWKSSNKQRYKSHIFQRKLKQKSPITLAYLTNLKKASSQKYKTSNHPFVLRHLFIKNLRTI